MIVTSRKTVEIHMAELKEILEEHIKKQVPEIRQGKYDMCFQFTESRETGERIVDGVHFYIENRTED